MTAAVHGHQARKRFGQNFLQDMGMIGRIVRAIRPQQGEHLVEIGPGMGAITEQLVDSGARLDAVELDRDLIPGLKVKFFNAPNFQVHEADALKFDFTSLMDDQQPLRLIGNLPYNISTPLIFHLLSFGESIIDMHFMLQKEVVDRLAAQPGTSQWGRLSVMTQYACQVESLFIVPPECFVPRPKVDSAIVRLTPQPPQHLAEDLQVLSETVRQAFGQRRKTLRNNLKGWVDDAGFAELNLDPSRRPETLSVAEFVALANWRVRQASTPPS